MSVILRLLGAELVLTVWGGCWARPCASNAGRVSWKTPASAAASTVLLKILRRLMTPMWLLRGGNRTLLSESSRERACVGKPGTARELVRPERFELPTY